MTATSQRLAGSRTRGLAWNYFHRAMARALRLPPPTTDYTIHRRVRAPMRDGVELLADHYAPTTTARGTLLVRGPYGRTFPFSVLFARLYAAHGYHVVLQSVRGTFGSGGVFEPMINEAADGADTAAWLCRQPWFTGRFATVGLSYLGFTQWALLQDPPPEMAAAVITVGPHDFSAACWGTGAFTLNDYLGWCDLVGHQEDGTRLRAGVRQFTARRRLARATAALPLGEAGRSLLGTVAPWYEPWLEHPNRDDPFWQPFRFDAALDRIDVPVLLISGWQDIFVRQTLEQYRHLRARGADVALTVGPWTHTQLMTTGAGPVARASLHWLDTHLAGVPTIARSPVRIFITGDRWVDLASWPPPVTDHALHLRSGGALGGAPAPGAAPPSTFRFDPADPTPTIGGRLLAPEGGYRNDNRLARRDDVLAFTGEPLAADLSVLGTPVVELSHAADNPYVDLFVRVSEVDARGRSRNVSDGYRRLVGTTEPNVVRIELDPIAHRFPAGSRIRLLIAGGCHPRYARNLGTDEPAMTARRMVPATHHVWHGVSRLVLPARSADAGPDHGGEDG
jgi:uncharacterized protein